MIALRIEYDDGTVAWNNVWTETQLRFLSLNKSVVRVGFHDPGRFHWRCLMRRCFITAIPPWRREATVTVEVGE